VSDFLLRGHVLLLRRSLSLCQPGPVLGSRDLTYHPCHEPSLRAAGLASRHGSEAAASNRCCRQSPTAASHPAAAAL
jgi:hypothetical protein